MIKVNEKEGWLSYWIAEVSSGCKAAGVVINIKDQMYENVRDKFERHGYFKCGD